MVECLAYNEEVTGSSPVIPKFSRDFLSRLKKLKEKEGITRIKHVKFV